MKDTAQRMEAATLVGAAQALIAVGYKASAVQCIDKFFLHFNSIETVTEVDRIWEALAKGLRAGLSGEVQP